MTLAVEYATVIELLHGCTAHGDEIEYDKHEVQILCAGGVSIADWDRAIDSWTRSGTEYQHFRYIRAVALANAARRLYDAENALAASHLQSFLSTYVTDHNEQEQR